MKRLLLKISTLFLMLTLCPSLPAWADSVAVIVNKENFQPVTKEFLTKVYLGKISTWPDGTPVMVFEQAEDNPIHDKFYTEVLGKSPALVKTIWTQNIFTGKRLPPKIANPDAEMKKLINSNKNAIGYINASNVDGTVKAIVP